MARPTSPFVERRWVPPARALVAHASAVDRAGATSPARGSGLCFAGGLAVQASPRGHDHRRRHVAELRRMFHRNRRQRRKQRRRDPSTADRDRGSAGHADVRASSGASPCSWAAEHRPRNTLCGTGNPPEPLPAASASATIIISGSATKLDRRRVLGIGHVIPARRIPLRRSGLIEGHRLLPVAQFRRFIGARLISKRCGSLGNIGHAASGTPAAHTAKPAAHRIQ